MHQLDYHLSNIFLHHNLVKLELINEHDFCRLIFYFIYLQSFVLWQMPKRNYNHEELKHFYLTLNMRVLNKIIYLLDLFVNFAFLIDNYLELSYFLYH